MLAILSVVMPVFLLSGAGYLAARTGKFPDSAIDGVSIFVTRFAAPVFLFSKMYALRLADAFSLGMVGAFYAAAALNFTFALIAARRLGRRPGEAVAIGFAAFFSNSVLLGLPVVIRAYGDVVAQPAYAIIALHAPVLYTIGIVAMESSRQNGAGAFAALRRAGVSIASNALMIGVALGLSLNLLQMTLPEPVLAAVEMLAAAALPTAIFVLGATLARYRIQAEAPWAVALSGLHPVAQPLIVWVLCGPLLRLPIEFQRAAVMIAAMPAGMNIYIFAITYRRAEGVAASTVLISTVLSLVSISVWLSVLGGVEDG